MHWQMTHGSILRLWEEKKSKINHHPTFAF